jgi:malonyl CoA-acyl carrier protein transacylase
MSVYMFPGQGSQYLGMGEELFASFPAETKKANEILGYSIEELCLKDPYDRLKQTEYTQPAIYFVSCLSYLKRLKENNSMLPTFVCGHSLGEYAALFASEVFDLYTGLSIVKKRGQLMAGIQDGAMLAVLGPNALNANGILKDMGIDTIDSANFNSHQQIVLSGLESDIQRAAGILEKQDYKCIRLNVSGAFHSRYMNSVRINFIRFLMQYELNSPKISVVSSATAVALEQNYILETLGFQLTMPVKWMQTIAYLHSLSEHTFNEIGPGEVLTRLNFHLI